MWQKVPHDAELFNDPVAMVVISGLLEEVELLHERQFCTIEQFIRVLGKCWALIPEEETKVEAKKP